MKRQRERKAPAQWHEPAASGKGLAGVAAVTATLCRVSSGFRYCPDRSLYFASTRGQGSDTPTRLARSRHQETEAGTVAELVCYSRALVWRAVVSLIGAVMGAFGMGIHSRALPMRQAPPLGNTAGKCDWDVRSPPSS